MSAVRFRLIECGNPILSRNGPSFILTRRTITIYRYDPGPVNNPQCLPCFARRESLIPVLTRDAHGMLARREPLVPGTPAPTRKDIMELGLTQIGRASCRERP